MFVIGNGDTPEIKLTKDMGIYKTVLEEYNEAQWELFVLSESVVHENISSLLSADHDGLTTVQGELQVVSRSVSGGIEWCLP